MSLRENKDIALMLLVMLFAVGAVLFGVYMENQKPTITLKKDEWECVNSERRTHLQPMTSGKVTTLQPMTSTVCTQYNRLAD